MAREMLDPYPNDVTHYARLQEALKEIERLHMQLVACGVAALSNTESSVKEQRITKDNPYWSASYGDVCRAVDAEIELRKQRDALAKMLDRVINETCPEVPWLTEEARALLEETKSG